MDAAVQNQQMKRSNMFFTFFHYHYLKLGVVQTKSVFHLSFQESIFLLHETRALFSEAHTSSAPHYSLLPPLLPVVSVSPPGGWENCFFISCYHNSPLLPLTVRLTLVSVFSYLLCSESFITSNREPSVFPPTKPFPPS